MMTYFIGFLFARYALLTNTFNSATEHYILLITFAEFLSVQKKNI